MYRSYFQSKIKAVRSPGDYQRFFWIFLGATTLFRLIYISLPNLVPQEAYYWLYSKHLALSYFDHPPLSAWTIALCTYLGGDIHFFVRLGAVLYSAASAIVIYLLAKVVLRSNRLAFWTVLLMNCSVVFAIGAVIFTPDTPMILFWALVILSVYKVTETEKWWWWYAAGLFLGLAFLSKYTSGLLIGCTFLYLLLSKKQRHWLLSVHPYMAVLLAVSVFSPVLIWNMEHDWASLAFQSTRRIGMMGSFKPVHFFELIGSQLAMLTPLLFIGMIYALCLLSRRWWLYRSERSLFIISYSVPVILFLFLVSFRTLIKMNWPAPAYVAGIIGTVLILAEKLEDFPHIWQRWIRSGITVAIALVGLAHLLPLITFFPLGSGDTWSGWPQLSRQVETMKSEFEKEPFVFSPSYKISSQLVFYSKDKKMAYAENVLGKTALQFDYWNSVDNLIGRDAILVYSNSMKLRGADKKKLPELFTTFEYSDTLTIKKNFQTVREFYLLKCFDYRGPPKSTSFRSEKK